MCTASFILRFVFIDCFLQCVDAFVDELQWEEDNSAKCDKICKLKLRGEEWEQVNLFLGLLSVRQPFFAHKARPDMH
jgi:hypothetical protein